MADILIKGMEMPRSCQECFWVLGYDSIPNCPDIETSNLNVYLGDDRKGRHPDCPLVEIPDHGDLIERDSLFRYDCIKPKDSVGREQYDTLMGYEVYDMIENAPVIIPSNREGRNYGD